MTTAEAVKVLREALKFIANGCLVPPDGGAPIWPDDAIEAANKALAATESAVESTDKIERYIILQRPERYHTMRMVATPEIIDDEVKKSRESGIYERVIVAQEVAE